MRLDEMKPFEAPNFHGEWKFRKDDGRGQPEIFDHCSYCGSISAGHFLKACENVYEINGADWKYGWPHKFYINWPNPKPDELRFVMSTSRGSKPVYNKDTGIVEKYIKIGPSENDQMNIWTDKYGWSGQGTYKFIHMKFYSEHLKDIGLTESETALIQRRTGVEFVVDNGQLKYKAPYRGFQV